MACSKNLTSLYAIIRHSRIPGMDSIRGRYLYGAVLFLVILLGAVWLAEDKVRQTTDGVIARSAQRNEISQILKNLTLQAWSTQITLQGYTQSPNAQRKAIVERSLEQISIQIGVLKSHAYVAGNASVNSDIGAIKAELNTLRDPSIAGDKIAPAFGSIWMALDGIENWLEAAMVADQSGLTRISAGLSRTFQGFAAVAIALVVMGLLFFELTIRRPLAMVVKALKAQASGAGNVQIIDTNLSETRDLSEAFEHMRGQVQSRQQRLETILDNAAEGIITFDKNGIIDSFNSAAEKLFGYKQGEIKGSDIAVLIPPTDARDRRKDYLEHFMRSEIARLAGREGEVIGLHKDGTRFPMALKISEITLEGRPFYTGLVADISERKALYDRLRFMAEHDGLTGLYNRTYFLDELERTVGRVQRHKKPSAVLYLDLDNFKYVNDTLGHAAGDILLVEVTSVLSKRARKCDLTARLGGDEFAVLLYDLSAEQAMSVAESFRSVLSQFRFVHKGKRVNIGCSIGVSVITHETQTAAQALMQADIGCHLAKRHGRNCVHRYEPSDESNITNMALDMGWSQRIRDAIEHNHFLLACQPIMDTVTGRIESYEVLIRLREANGEYILPGGFLPVAERFGLAVDIDKWVIVHAIEVLAEQRKTQPDLRFSINLSGHTLSEQHVCELILSRLSITGLPPSALTFEITETAAISDMTKASAFLSRLQNIGCMTALDDFGSGLSSFTYLRDLPIDIVKIDGSFVKNVAANRIDQATVRAMNDIAHAMGKKTVAEFVESEEILKLLVEYGVDYVQGYYFGRPEAILPCDMIATHGSASGICSKYSDTVDALCRDPQ